MSWSTVWAAIVREAAGRVVEPGEAGRVEMIGFDETVMASARRRRRRRLVTAAVDVSTGRVIDVFEGHDAADLRAWLARMPAGWLAGIGVVSVDPHEGYRSAVVRPDPRTGRASPLAGATVVVDPFHIVRLANQAVTRARQRVQQQTLEHRGWKGDPLYDIRKLLLLGAERVDEAGWVRLHAGLRDGDPDDVGTDTRVAKEKVRDLYLTEDPDEAADRLTDAIAWCEEPEATPEQRTLAKTCAAGAPRSSPTTPPAPATARSKQRTSRSSKSNAPGAGSGTSRTTGYASCSPGTGPLRETQPVTSIRPRRPRLVA